MATYAVGVRVERLQEVVVNAHAVFVQRIAIRQIVVCELVVIRRGRQRSARVIHCTHHTKAARHSTAHSECAGNTNTPNQEPQHRTAHILRRHGSGPSMSSCRPPILRLWRHHGTTDECTRSGLATYAGVNVASNQSSSSSKSSPDGATSAGVREPSPSNTQSGGGGGTHNTAQRKEKGRSWFVRRRNKTKPDETSKAKNKRGRMEVVRTDSFPLFSGFGFGGVRLVIRHLIAARVGAAQRRLIQRHLRVRIGLEAHGRVQATLCHRTTGDVRFRRQTRHHLVLHTPRHSNGCSMSE